MPIEHAEADDELLAVGPAAALATVTPKTLKRWERDGRITSVRTPTGHRRFRRSEIEALLTSGKSA
jgi:excisionase family DNA binding protein